MRTLAATIESRLRADDVTQVATLVMAALVVTLATVWPSSARSINESWYAFAQTRAVVLALLAIGFGAAAAREGDRRSVGTVAAVVVVALLTLPLEIAAYASTYPATPLWWSFVGVVVAPIGYFAIGVALGHLAARLRLGILLPLLVPALLVGFLMLDLNLGWTVFNPLTASLDTSTRYAAAMAALAIATLGWSWRRWRRAGAEVAA